MTGDQWLLAAAALVVVLALVVLTCTAPGGGLTPGMVVALWAYAPPLYRRHCARQYHRHGSPGAHRHIRPSRWHRTSTPPAAPAPARALTPGQELRQVQEVLGSAARVVRVHPDTVPWDLAAARMETTQPIRQFVRHA